MLIMMDCIVLPATHTSYPEVERATVAFNPQQQSITTDWQVLISMDTLHTTVSIF